MIFAEGDDLRVLRAAVAWQRGGMGQSLVVGREAEVKEALESAGLGDAVRELTVVNSGNSRHLETYQNALYARLQRKGFDREDAFKLAARDRHVFAALMLMHGHGDGLVTGATRKNAPTLSQIGKVFDVTPADGAVGLTAVLHNGRIIAHIVDHAHKAVVEHLMRGVEHGLQSCHRGAAGRECFLPVGRNFCALLFGQ